MDDVDMVSIQPVRDPENNEIKYLQKYAAQSGARILDIGCGDGRLTWFFTGDADLVVGADTAVEALQSAYAERPDVIRAQFGFTTTSGEALAFADETFDLAIYSWSL
jgi:ubiquinone/menaquinone biosynthesis C-methylase UbiE